MPVYFKFALIFSFFLFSYKGNAHNFCGRVAFINGQEVLIDQTNSLKGEGLRFFIEKDSKALEYLNTYQNNTQLTWDKAVLGSLGGGMILSSFFLDSNNPTKKILLFSGIGLISLNFFYVMTIANYNENNLLKAIEEYNKRNLPQIYLIPEQHDKNAHSFGLLLQKKWEF